MPTGRCILIDLTPPCDQLWQSIRDDPVCRYAALNQATGRLLTEYYSPVRLHRLRACGAPASAYVRFRPTNWTRDQALQWVTAGEQPILGHGVWNLRGSGCRTDLRPSPISPAIGGLSKRG